MILADKIILGRKRLGLSQEQLAERLSVSRQAVSKWESAQAMPDVDRIVELATLFGVSTDCLLKDDRDMPAEAGTEGDAPRTRRLVTVADADAFCAARRRASRFISLGTALAVLSPVLLIFLAGFADAGIGNVTENLAAALGMGALFALVAGAVLLFIFSGRGMGSLHAILEEPFDSMPGVADMARERRTAHESAYTAGVAVGVVLCILAVVPLIIAGAMNAPDHICTSMTALLLAVVAIGASLIVRVSVVRGSFDALLQEGEYSKQAKKVSKTMSLVSGAYWCIATAGYLGWSFATDGWRITWIVWPVAGVLFAAVMHMARLFMKNKE